MGTTRSRKEWGKALPVLLKKRCLSCRSEEVEGEDRLRSKGVRVSSKIGKYKAKKTEVNGIIFDSKKEADHYCKLKLLEQSGVIHNLECQHRFRIEINGQKICDYVADFVFLKNGKQVVQDVKSNFTRKLPVYRLKYKLMKACLGIEIEEI